MADEIIVETTSTEVVEVGVVGPQGPKGDKGDPGDIAGEIAWDNVTNKPSTFAPSSHTHVAADVTDFSAAVAAAAPPTTDASLLTSGTLNDARLSAAATASLGKADTASQPGHTHTAANVTDFNAAAAAAAPVQSVAGRTGAITLAVADVANAVSDSDARLSDARPPTSHTHGNLTNDGKVGSTSGLPLVTTTAGAVTTLALGTAGQILRTKSDLSGVEFADPAASGVTGAASSAADVLGVSGSDITGVDAGSDKIVFWDDSASELTYLATVGPTFDGTTLRWPVELVIACSDESTDLTTGTAKVTFRAPYAFTLTAVRASVNTAPTGSTLIVDINNGANSALSTKLSIDADEKTSTTAASAAVIDTDYDDVSDDAEITIDIDQIGSTIAGKGLKVTLIGTRA